MTETASETAFETTVHKTVFLAVEKPKVWEFLTRADKLGQWFHPAQQDLVEGQEYTLLNGLDGDRMCWGKVEKMRAPDYMRWSFTVGALDGHMTTVEWKLEAAPGGTRLSLVHSGLPTSGEGFGLVLALDHGWHGFTLNLQEQTRAEATGDYCATIVVPAAPDVARKAIRDEMHLWWSDRIEPRTGGAVIRFNRSHVDFDMEDGDTQMAMTWTCRDANMIIENVEDTSEWKGTRLLWQIAPLGTGSRVTLTHEGLNAGLACQDVCTRGWQQYFENSLRAHLSGQAPSPQTH
ncbi:SRPBCC family protein [Tritonibacter litoralis]|nr:SRPBCC family protein [Tritonibacter litoralis]